MRRRMRKSQVSMEFMFLIVVSFMILAVFLMVVRAQVVDIAQKREYTYIKDVTFMVQNEINSAANLEDGYERTFNIPKQLEGYLDYSIRIEGNYVVANVSSNEFFATIQPVNGTLIKGDNVLRKEGGVLNIN